MRFFLTAPLFLILAAVAAIPLEDEWLASRWSPAALGLTHLITLGYLGQVMVGSLLQMLPVVIGSPVPAAMSVAGIAHAGLSLGALLLAAGLWQAVPWLIQAALALLAVALGVFLAAAAVSLLRARAANMILQPIRQAWLALLVTFGLGLYLGGGLAGAWPLIEMQALTQLHAAWGLLGWVLILVAGVAYHVVPMLQLTPPYPDGLMRWLTWLLLAALVLHALALLLPAAAATAMEWAAWLLAGATSAWYAVATLQIQRRRRRKLPDTTLYFWRFAMTSLLTCVGLAPLAVSGPEAWRDGLQVLLGIVFLLGFAVSVVAGMLYKIVPFLAWFHLQAQTQARAGTIPNMKDFMPEALAMRHLRLHVIGVLLLLPAPFLPAPLSAPGLVLLAASGWVQWQNLHRAKRLFDQYGGRLA
ncbi:hypothetical protein EDC61_10150 [Sulfuritortus calidifontis]|uniref:Transmembrane protein n=1 Tax=Sulfuritortus calidifontis TaxID=1914471 RepID=A0A4R3JYI1_9PROT|nr:hypothetical protein [Sulfuritortus calidifontis]TCS73828.1 hypothetical protein EDC61_10150 [Sulfuritortus calidifontis]